MNPPKDLDKKENSQKASTEPSQTEPKPTVLPPPEEWSKIPHDKLSQMFAQVMLEGLRGLDEKGLGHQKPDNLEDQETSK
jgi:hypothetical protein